MVQLRNILIPTDFSDYASVAIEYGSTLADAFAAKVHLIHVLETHLSAVPVFGGGLAVSSNVSESKSTAQKMLAELAEGRDMTLCTLDGPPFLEILRYAEQHDIDMIVMGTHGRSGLEHVLLGSVAERIVRKSACPVLTIRHPDHRFVMPFDKVK